MTARKRFLSIVMVLALGLVVILPSFIAFGDRYYYDIAGEGTSTIDNEWEQYVVEDISQDSEVDESTAAFFGTTQFGTNHFVRDVAELSSALSRAACGDAITLMNDVAFAHRINIFNRSITLVTNGFTLSVDVLIGPTEMSALQINNGALLLDNSNGGEFNVTGLSGVSVINGTAEVTNATGTTGNGVFVGLDGYLHVRGNVTSNGGNSIGALAQDGGVINIDGDAIATGVGNNVIYAIDGANINIGGDVTSTRGIFGVRIRGGAVVVINGDVTATSPHSMGIRASGADSFIHVLGNVTSFLNTVFAENGGVIVVEGNATAVGSERLFLDASVVAHARGINSKVHVGGNVISTGDLVQIVMVVIGAKITIDGDIIIGDNGRGSSEFGIVAYGNGIANIGGNLLITEVAFDSAVFAASGAEVNIMGDIIDATLSRHGAAIRVHSSGRVTVGGNVIADGFGASIQGSGYARISGALTVPTYVALFGITRLTSADYITPTTLPGYFTYAIQPTNPTATLWVRGDPTVTTLTTATSSLTRSGGNSPITLTGSDFGAANIRIAAFLNNTGNALYTQTPTSTATQATTTLNFPANTVNAIRNYTIRVSLDGGATWLTTPTTTVTVASASTPPSHDTTLSSLYTTPGILSPAFAPNVREYTVSVGSHVTDVNISAIANCPYATVTITGYNLTDGQNTVTVLVTAQDGTARIHTFTITVTRATAVVRLHWHIPGVAPYTEIGLPETNATIPPHLRPTIPIRYGTIGSPGWAFLGWYEELFPYMHYVNNQNSITHTQRLAAIDLLSNLVITEAMLDDNGVYELHASWLQYGDLSGDGTISPLDRSLMQNRIMGGLTNDDMIMQTANLDKSEAGVSPTDRSLLQNHILGAPGVILPSL